MKNDLLIVGAFVLLHIAALRSLAVFLGSLNESYLVPTTIIRSRFHLLGLVALFLGIIVIVGAAHAGSLGYGIFAGVALVIVDLILTYRACAQWSRSRQT